MINIIILSVALGLLYNVLTHKIVKLSLNSSDRDATQKMQISIVLLFLFALVAILLSRTVFRTHSKLNNKIVEYGLLFGGIVLILYTAINRWTIMTDITKLSIFIITFITLIWYCYKL